MEKGRKKTPHQGNTKEKQRRPAEPRAVKATLRESEEKYRHLFESSLAGIGILKGARVITANKALLDMFGYDTFEEFSAISIMDHTAPESRKFIRERLKKRQKGEPLEPRYEYRIIRKDGEIRDIEMSTAEIVIGGKQHVQSTFRDITRLKREEEMLRESRERFKSLFENAIDAIFLMDTEGRYIDVNAKATELTGYSRKELLTKNIRDLVPPGTPVAIFSRILTEGKAKGEFEILRKDGRLVPAEMNATGIKLGKVKIIEGIIRDLTDRKRMEEEILKIKKLESLGILAGGIAHDFNNLLQGLLGNISFAKLLSRPGEQIYEVLESAESTYARARSLTSQLLTFTSGGDTIRKPVALGKLIADTVDFSLSGSRVKSRLQIPPGLWPVEADEGQLTQVIQNLVQNARDAMPGGGTVTVKAENTVTDEDEVFDLVKGRHVKISFQDHGAGIAPKNLDRIFDPYFTTKERGNEKGLGLGLTICHSIVKKHGGCITVDSHPGKGADFTVYLPASEKEVAEHERVKTVSQLRKGKVLVMDDEDLVTGLAEGILSHMGYEAAVARDGKEALEIYKEAKNERRPFDIVILDLTVPGGMGGEETLKHLQSIDPKVKAVISSGYLSDPVMKDYRGHGFQGALSKPYRVEELRGVLSRLLR